MTFGPCSGVRSDLLCEIGHAPCPFVNQPTRPWPALVREYRRHTLFAENRPFVLADLPHAPLDATSIARSTAALAGHADAVLFGDVGWARAQLPPSYRAAIVAREGVLPWAGLNCRDRNRVALEGEVAALADIGAAVHCVTGDHTDLGRRGDAQPVFDLDSTQLTALAAARGMVVSVAENPVAPPVALRPTRLVQKMRAGADVCIVNHAGSAANVDRFVTAARRVGAQHTVFLACVPLVTGRAGLALLRTFTGLALPDGYIEAIETAVNPTTAAIDAAIQFAQSVLALDGVDGVNVSCAIAPGDEDAAARAIVSVCDALR